MKFDIIICVTVYIVKLNKYRNTICMELFLKENVLDPLMLFILHHLAHSVNFEKPRRAPSPLKATRPKCPRVHSNNARK